MERGRGGGKVGEWGERREREGNGGGVGLKGGCEGIRRGERREMEIA